jgi:hypothetical protein
MLRSLDMKTFKSIAAILIALLSFGYAYPTPIPKSKHTIEKACEVVMKEFAKEAKDYPPRWRDEAFPRSVVYTNLEYSRELQDWIPEGARGEVAKSEQAWLLKEWGWLVTVVMAHDLSQSMTYFVRENGQVSILWETN